jgi:hypothetical protein
MMQVLEQERIAFGTQPDRDCTEGRIVMQGERGRFHGRVVNLTSFLFSFLRFRVEKSLSQQHDISHL